MLSQSVTCSLELGLTFVPFLKRWQELVVMFTLVIFIYEITVDY